MLVSISRRPSTYILGLAAAAAIGYGGAEYVLHTQHDAEVTPQTPVRISEEDVSRAAVQSIERSLADNKVLLVDYWHLKQNGIQQKEFAKAYAAALPTHDAGTASAAYDIIENWGDAVGRVVTAGVDHSTDGPALAAATRKLAQVDASVVLATLHPPLTSKHKLSKHEQSLALIESTLAHDELSMASALFDQNRDDMVILRLKQNLEQALDVEPKQTLQFETLISESVVAYSARAKLEATVASAILRGGIGADDIKAENPVMTLLKTSQDTADARLAFVQAGVFAKVIVDAADNPAPALPRPAQTACVAELHLSPSSHYFCARRA